MCGRYGLFAPPDEITRLFGTDPAFAFEPHYNIAPSQAAPVVIGAKDGPRAGLLRWGFHVGSAEKGRTLINARSETVHSSGAFRTAFGRRRCVIPASGFYEWRIEGDGKVPYWIHDPDGDLLGLAGIWGRDPRMEDGAERRTGDPGYAILTQPATGGLAQIHARMPVVLTAAGIRAWLDQESAPEVLAGVLADRPETELVPSSGLSGYPVSTLVNRPANDDEACLLPVGEPLF